MRCDQATAMRRNASSRVGQTAAFEDARAVATCEDSNGATLLAVADLGKHQVRLLGLRGLSVVSTRVLGTGVPGHVSGAINSASFYEPLALVYADKILYVGCYGGEHHGTVSAVTPTAFAVRTLGALSKAYNAIGYVPSSATAEQRAHRHPPVREAVRDLAVCGKLLEAASRSRNEALGGGRGAEGPEGTWPLFQAEALNKTAVSVGSVLDAMEAQGLSLDGVTLAAFVNESGIESSFGQADMRTQFRHPDQLHYCQRKPAAVMRAINRCCQTPHSEHTGRDVHYQAPQQSSLSAMHVACVVRRAWRALQGQARPLEMRWARRSCSVRWSARGSCSMWRRRSAPTTCAPPTTRRVAASPQPCCSPTRCTWSALTAQRALSSASTRRCNVCATALRRRVRGHRSRPSTPHSRATSLSSFHPTSSSLRQGCWTKRPDCSSRCL